LYSRGVLDLVSAMDTKPGGQTEASPITGQRDERAVGRDGRSVVLWAARLLVAMVCIWNLTAAVPFVLNPAGYTHSFELGRGGLAGEVMVRGLGVAFLMWQIPFLPVIWHPGRHRICFLCVLGMQLVGLVGESMMLAGLPAGHAPLRATGWRFVSFDATGLVVMALAYAALHWGRRGRRGW
jgi:hypothetical protein